MKIAVITLGIYPIQIGGVEILAYKQVHKLAKRGHEVVCFTKRHSGDRPVAGNEANPVHVVGSSMPVVGQLWFLASVTWSLLRLRNDLDVVHVQYASYFIIPAYLLRRLCGVPYVVGCVGSDLQNWGRREFWGRLLGVLLRGASFVTALSSELRNEITGRYGVRPDRAVLLPNPFDEEEVTAKRRESAASTHTVIFLGNLKPVKDPMTTARAFAILHKSLPDAELVFVGDGPCRAELEGFVKGNGLERCVAMKGLLKHEEAMAELGNSDLLAISSLREGGPITAMEAMALGVPVVGTDVGGLHDLITDGANGLLVPPGAHEELARAMYRVLADRAFAQSISAEASKSIVGRTWANTIAAYEDLYRRATSERRQSQPRQT